MSDGVLGWARKRKGARLTRTDLNPLREMLPNVLHRMWICGYPSTVHASDLSRQSLTRLQRELQNATETSSRVAEDDLLQRFRKQLHQTLDH